MALLDRCVNPAEIEGLLTAAHEMEDRVPSHPTRRIGSAASGHGADLVPELETLHLPLEEERSADLAARRG